jgi:hypothetical protein
LLYAWRVSVELDGFVEIRDRFVVLALGAQGISAIAVSARILRVLADQFVAGGIALSPVPLAQMSASLCADTGSTQAKAETAAAATTKSKGRNRSETILEVS